MSNPPLGWEQSAQILPAQPSPVDCSTPPSNSGSIHSSASANHPSDTLLHVSQPPAITSQSPQTPALPARGFLNIVRHGAGLTAIYLVTYHRLDSSEIMLKPVLAEGPRQLIELLECLGVNLDREVRGALEDILRLGSANIPDLCLSGEQMAEMGLVEI
jgi:hypothetical protein